MLILRRKLGQKILISGGITITVTGIAEHGGHVRLGFEAPEAVKVLRQELEEARDACPVCSGSGEVFSQDYPDGEPCACKEPSP